jgi:hypothetical protein
MEATSGVTLNFRNIVTHAAIACRACDAVAGVICTVTWIFSERNVDINQAIKFAQLVNAAYAVDRNNIASLAG